MVTSLRSKWAAGKAAAGWLFFRVARSLRIDLDMLVAPPASLREALRAGRALKNSQLTCGDVIIICETVHWLEMRTGWKSRARNRAVSDSVNQRWEFDKQRKAFRLGWL